MTTAIRSSRETTGTRKLHRLWWRSLIEFTCLSLIAVLCLEWLLNICGVGQQEFLQPDPILGCRHIPGKLVTWRLEGFSNDRLSSAGLRDVEHTLEKPAGTTRIALLGDSATEALQVPLSETFARRLELGLNQQGKKRVEVINFARSSYSTGQALLQFRTEVAAYSPDITVLVYNRGDAVENVRNPFAGGTEPRPYFYFDRQGQLRQDSVLLAKRVRDPLISFLQRHSRIYGVLCQTNLTLSIHERLYRKLRGWVLRLAFPKDKGQSAGAVKIAYPVPDAWKVTSALINQLSQSCRRASSSLVVVAFPNMIDDPEYAMQLASLAEQSKTGAFAYLDLTPSFKADRDPKSLFISYHLSRKGHKVVTEELLKFLQSPTFRQGNFAQATLHKE